ncbi:hypothetical protein B0A48_05883 [Cryoendolithus antarcticus]|uniref:Alpha/beta hydrolase fold-3 domain-containing protein n=1 Tax=Cryoendolithus antarcticus TaxID=1507870 RepID=A0A1V8TC85_9PEZI|nr:hypothetical protein B0A48_05883 [Cryoendolithus antarcticus]
MHDVRVRYKQDDFGNDIFARLAWSQGTPPSDSKPILLVFHGGGLIVGSAGIIPKPQVEWLVNNGFLVVIPNYRLVPQVTGRVSYADCEEAYDWAVSTLLEIMNATHGVMIDSRRVVTMGHSVGGSIALHVAAIKDVKAVAAFYPSLYLSDTSTTSHKPTSVPPFGLMPDFEPTQDDWAIIKPADKQLTEAPLGLPGLPPSPRTKWQMSILKNGQWAKIACPDGQYMALDPVARQENIFPPTIIVQGDADNAPGSSLALAERAAQDLKARGTDVRLYVVPEATHMFDLPPMVGTSDLGPKWQAMVEAFALLKHYVQG